MDLGELFAVLQADRQHFRAVARGAAEVRTGESVPDEEPLETTRAKAGGPVTAGV